MKKGLILLLVVASLLQAYTYTEYAQAVTEVHEELVRQELGNDVLSYTKLLEQAMREMGARREEICHVFKMVRCDTMRLHELYAQQKMSGPRSDYFFAQTIRDWQQQALNSILDELAAYNFKATVQWIRATADLSDQAQEIIESIGKQLPVSKAEDIQRLKLLSSFIVFRYLHGLVRAIELTDQNNWADVCDAISICICKGQESYWQGNSNLQRVFQDLESAGFCTYHFFALAKRLYDGNLESDLEELNQSLSAFGA